MSKRKESFDDARFITDFIKIRLPPQQLKNLVRGVVWRDEHFNGMSMKAIAEREGVSKASVGQIIMRSFDTLMAM